MRGRAEIRRTDYNALCALIAKTGADRTSAATIDGVLALQNIATNRDDVRSGQAESELGVYGLFQGCLWGD